MCCWLCWDSLAWFAFVHEGISWICARKQWRRTLSCIWELVVGRLTLLWWLSMSLDLWFSALGRVFVSFLLPLLLWLNRWEHNPLDYIILRNGSDWFWLYVLTLLFVLFFCLSQQALVIAKSINFKVATHCGGNRTVTTHSDWEREVSENEVIFLSF